MTFIPKNRDYFKVAKASVTCVWHRSLLKKTCTKNNAYPWKERFNWGC